MGIFTKNTNGFSIPSFRILMRFCSVITTRTYATQGSKSYRGQSPALIGRHVTTA